MLVAVKSKWRLRPAQAKGTSLAANHRLKKLAERIDALVQKDEVAIARANEIASLRRQSALELHTVCATFVREINRLVTQGGVELDPSSYAADHFQEMGVNLFQINVRGRIVQIRFEATAELISSEEFRIPYFLEGSVRCFNQQLLDHDLIEEQMLFCTLERSGGLWRFFDARTYRSGPFNLDYLIALMDRLV